MQLVVGLFVGFVATMAVAMLLLRGDVPPLTAEAFDQAVRTWERHRPASYDMDLVLAGDQTGTVHVEVRDGRLAAMTRDGVAPRQRRTWDAWSVEGQFDIIGADLAAATRAAGGDAASGGQLVLRARFDPHYGYPAAYERIVLFRGNRVRWDVVRFAPVE